jgi:hypothetical protein
MLNFKGRKDYRSPPQAERLAVITPPIAAAEQNKKTLNSFRESVNCLFKINYR